MKSEREYQICTRCVKDTSDKEIILLEKQDMLYGKMGHVVVDKKAAFKVRSDFDFKVAGLISDGAK